MKMDNSTLAPVVKDIEAALRVFVAPDQVVELRAIKVPDRKGGSQRYAKPRAGYFDAAHLGEMAKWAARLDELGAKAVYFTLNPAEPDLIGRAYNKVRGDGETGPSTTAAQILARRWMLVDLDSIRPTATSSTDEQWRASQRAAMQLRTLLRAKGWPRPVVCDSGNGSHLLYRVELAATVEHTALVKACLERLDELLDVEGIKVDRSVFDLPRICKIPGTVSRKGDPDDPRRPHRRSRMVEAPEEPIAVPIALLRELAAPILKRAAVKPERQAGGFDIDEWLSGPGSSITVAREKTGDRGGRVLILDACPFAADHTDSSAHITIGTTGMIAAGCHHDSCGDWKWRDLREHLEPEARTRREDWESRKDRPASRPEAPRDERAPMPNKRPEPEVRRAETCDFAGNHRPADEADDGREEVCIDAGRVAPMVDVLETALLKTGGVYQRSGALVHVVRLPAAGVRRGVKRPMGAPQIAPVMSGRLLELACEALAWKRYDGRKKKWVAAMCPASALSGIAARGEWLLPPLDAVATAPQLRPDGTVKTAPGYDPRTRTWIELGDGAAWKPGPKTPTLGDAQAALGALGEPLQDFPWAAPHDSSAAIAAVITACARSAIDGAVPLFAIRAPTPGSGKSLLAEIITMIATGAAAAQIAPAKDDEEDRKRLLALGMAGDPVILIDNVERPFGSAPLASALTAGLIRDRVLGETRLATAVWRALVIVTGNNLVLRGDLARRVVPVDLDPRCEAPEERTGWRIPHVLAWVAAQRPRLYMAALTVLRAYLGAGSPPVGVAPMGSFEEWSGLVRSAIIWAGLPDPSTGRVKMREDSDPARDALVGVLTAWRAMYGAKACTVGHVLGDIDAAAGDQDAKDLREALSALVTGGDGKLTGVRLGRVLRSKRDRIVEGMRLEEAGRDGRRRSILWRVVKIDEVMSDGT